jgi:hypothetical protein
MLLVRLSDRELGTVEARAGAAGISRQRLLVEAATRGEATPSERQTLYTVLYSLQRIALGAANNLNQLARVANTTGQVLPGYEQTAAAVRDSLEALAPVLGRLGDSGLL